MNPRAVKADAMYVWRSWFRSGSGLVLALAMPLILFLTLGLVFGQAPDPRALVHVDDQDGSEAALAFVARLREDASLQVSLGTAPEGGEAAWLADGGYAALVRIPPGWGAEGEAEPLLLILAPQDSARARSVENAVRAAMAAPDVEDALATEQVEGRADAGYRGFLLPGAIGLSALMVGLPIGFSSIVELRHAGLLERLAVSPMGKREWLLARMLSISAIGLLAASVLVVAAVLLFRVPVTLTPAAVLLVLGGTLVFSGLGTILGVVVKRPESGGAVMNLVLLPLVMLSGAFFGIERLPSWLQPLSVLSPLTHLNDGLRSAMLHGLESSAMRSALVLLGIAALLVLSATKLIRWTEE